MELFLGYDPGGANKHGVVSVKIASDGSYGEMEANCLADASAVRRWLNTHPTAVALGIDTLLAWSWSGSRLCDDLLRERYGKTSSVVAQNSLYSAMTVNGVLVATSARVNRPEFPLVESHPKLLLRAAGGIVPVPARHHLELGYTEALHQGKPHNAKDDGALVHEDHMADAFIAAWCASRWYFKQWTTNLYDLAPSDSPYYFPAGQAAYPWPEPLTTPR